MSLFKYRTTGKMTEVHAAALSCYPVDTNAEQDELKALCTKLCSI